MHSAFERARTISGLRPLLADDGLLVLSEESLPVVALPRGRGVILGDIYRSGGEGPCSRFDPTDREADAVLGSGGSLLRDRAWGAYLSMIRHGPDRLLLMRDPSGAVPCYVARSGDIALCSDDLRWADMVLGRQFDVDRNMLRASLIFRDLRGRATCLIDVAELLPGELTSLNHGRLQPIDRWHPADFALGGPTDMPTAADLLRSRILSCVATQVGGRTRPLATVSGGLDSSIVAASLVASGTPPLGLTLVHPGPEGDERLYTAALSAALGLEMISAMTDADWVAPDLSLAAWLPRPAARSFSQARERAVLGAIEVHGCDSVFTGNGGDTLLGYSTTALPVLDQWMADRSIRGTWRVIDDVAMLHDATVWEVARRALRARSRGARPYPADTTFLADADGSPPDHPWLDGLESLPPGKAAQIRSLIGQHHHGEAMPAAEQVPIHSPFTAQPVVEACLAVPTWLNVAGGANRAVARHAFREMLPPVILHRRGKGGPDGLCQQMVRVHFQRFRSLLLDGRLRQWGIVPAEAVEKALADRAAFADGRLVRLLLLADAEAWVRMREAAAPPRLAPMRRPVAPA